MRVLKLILKILAALLLILAITVGLYVATSGVDRPEGEASRAFLAEGPWRVATREHTFVDRGRRTVPNGDFAGADSRTLESTIWYPAEGSGAVARERRPAGGFPLLVYVHGFMSMRSEGTYLAEHFASHGYIVVAADHPLTGFSAPGGPRLADVVHQPGDVSFLIDRFLAWSSDPESDFAGAVDSSRIGVMGLSLGGMTTALVAFHPRLRDPRLSAAVSIAGPSAMFLPAFFETTDIPFLMIAGDADAIVGYRANAASLPDRAPGAALVTLRGASHAAFADIARLFFRWAENPDALGCTALMEQVSDQRQSADWLEELGGLDTGVDASLASAPCEGPVTGRTMRPAHQHMLTALAAFSFLESHFAQEEAERRRAAAYFSSGLPSENPDVTVRPGSPQVASP